MSMHLVGPYLTTTNYKKRKFKMTKTMREQWMLEWMEKNRQRKRSGEAKISFEQFCDERRGIVVKVKVSPSKQGSYNGPSYTPPPGRETPRYPSLNSDQGVATKQERQVYTGTNMIGIGQLHKSNAIPVFKKEDAEDLAKMRRG